jgi:hypothetical protein
LSARKKLLEHESHHRHHPHGTGVRWLDIILGVAATSVSLVSLWLGLHSAHSMEKLWRPTAILTWSRCGRPRR